MAIETLLENNKQWAQQMVKSDPEYFTRLAQSQSPEFLWIGCSDSRVPATKVTGTNPGEMFVHRNIANLVIYTDVNLLSVLDYAVNHLKVKHVIVCGHYGCGGVKASMSYNNLDHILNMWLSNIKDVYNLHKEELNAIADEENRFNLLVELNVQAQVTKLANTAIIQKAWKNNNQPTLHGWVYGLKDGYIKTICDRQPNSSIEDIYRYKII